MSGQKFFQIMRFLAGGSMAVLVYYAILYTLTEYLHFWYIGSSVIGWMSSYAVSFLVQKFWTFKNRDVSTASRQFRLYILMAISILISNTFLLYVLVEGVGFGYLVAQLVISPILTIASYQITRKIFATN